MPTINTGIEFEVYCTVCNKNLDTDVKFERGGQRVYVEPCDNCMDAARYDGYVNGYADKMKDGTEH